MLWATALPVVAQQGGVVNVYSHRHYPADRALYNDFYHETGIQVNVLQAKSEELIERLRVEGGRGKADLLITVDVIRLERAKELGLLQPTTSARLNSHVPAALRDSDGYWYALTLRSRVIVYNLERVNPQRLSTYADLATERWRNKIVMRSSSHPYNVSLLSALITHRGEAAGRRWAHGVARNLVRPASGNDRDQIRQVAVGNADLTVANSYYVGLMINSESARDRELVQKVGIFYPNQNESGTHVNISGGAIVKGAHNATAARRLLEFLTSEEAQRIFADTNYEIPVNPELNVESETIPSREIKLDTAVIKKLEPASHRAIRIVEATDWR